MQIYNRILKYLKRYKSRLALSFVLSILFSFFSALSIYITIPLLRTLFMGSGEIQMKPPGTFQIENFFNQLQFEFEKYLIRNGKESAILKICIIMLIVFFLKNLTGYIHSLTMQFVEKGILRDLRNEIYEKLTSFPIKYFTEQRSGHLLNVMTNDITLVQSGISAVFYNIMKDPLLIIIYLILSLIISWQMTVIALLVFPFSVIIILKLGGSLRRRSRRAQEKLSDLLSFVTESIYAIKIIKAFNSENFMNKIFKKESEEHNILVRKIVRIDEMVSPMTEFLTIIPGVLIIWFGGREILVNNALRPEEFLGFLFIVFQLIVPIKNLGTVNNRIQQSSSAGKRIFEILDQPVEIQDSIDSVELIDFTDSVEIKDMSFGYTNKKLILKNINYKIIKSEVVAIVGPSGAGKSTLADLLARFYDVKTGEILIDGVNIKKIKISSLRKLIGIVPQETILFNDSIRNNILFGFENVEEEKLISTCKFANAYDFIMQTEKGFDTVVGERGMKLSGGQKQRIAIARALLRNPQILILDEATSSLDTESESLVQDALDRLMHNRTSIVIAHRLSTVRNANRIIVLDNGEIIQSGTHEELFRQKNGLYKKLYDIQFGFRFE